MIVIPQTRPEPAPIPGVAHATWAGEAEGLTQLSLWRQTLQPGAATPPHSHDCDEVVLCTAGQGEVHVDGQVHRFGADCTLVLRRGPVHQIFNTGSQPMEILGIFGATPVQTRLPDGEPLPLPWRT
ncbi:MAG: cupin domain-containing protein [Pseudomonadota bacterium]